MGLYMRKAGNLVGRRFGRLVVKYRIEGTNTWWCVCDCGNEKPIERYDLKPNHIKSCGCLHQGKLAKGHTTHGLSHTPSWTMWVAAKQRAKNKRLPFTLALTDIPTVPDTCPILGITLKAHHTRRGPQPDSPTLDRIISSRGYVPDNVRIISWRANKLKGDASLDELEKVCDYIRKEQPSP